MSLHIAAARCWASHMITNGYYCGNIRLGLREVRESGSPTGPARVVFRSKFFGEALASEVMCQRRASGGCGQPAAQGASTQGTMTGFLLAKA
jgi:hypothetical protein